MGAQFPRNLNWWSVIFRPIQGLTFIESWFPERSANFIQCYQERILHSRALLVCCHCIILRPVSGKSRQRFAAEKRFHVYRVCIIKDQSFNNFENDTMKLSVNEAKLTGLWARNFTTIQLLLISKFAFRPEKLPGLSRNGPLHCLLWGSRARTFQTIDYTTFQELYFNYNLFKWLKWNSHISSNDLRFPFFPIILAWYYMINYPGGRGLLGWTPTPL